MLNTAKSANHNNVSALTAPVLVSPEIRENSVWNWETQWRVQDQTTGIFPIQNGTWYMDSWEDFRHQLLPWLSAPVTWRFLETVIHQKPHSLPLFWLPSQKVPLSFSVGNCANLRPPCIIPSCYLWKLCVTASSVYHKVEREEQLRIDKRECSRGRRGECVSVLWENCLESETLKNFRFMRK